MSNTNLSSEQNYSNVPTTKSNFIAGRLFHLIDRVFDGLAAVYGDFKPAVNKVSKMLGTKAENVERQLILKRNYTESEAAVFFNFLTDFVHKYNKKRKLNLKELIKLRQALKKDDLKRWKHFRKTMKEEEKTNKLSEKLGRGKFEGSSNEELKASWREKYSSAKNFEKGINILEWIINEMDYEFKYVFKVLKKHYRKNPELVRKITDLQVEALPSEY
ncbi:hypothetical protein [uncultured Treponema sp.]|uniref:hypothetical protein n=1 Tax=uncultured Treponema sp. TaxID=162155 RepID=UPI0025FCBBD4|nr:hypothetical protein [uncultured Treponema sp.]